MSTKPRFLIDIERNIRRELRTPQEPGQKRIQVFRRAFEDLISSVQTFGPLLAQIKEEYEELLAKEARSRRILEVWHLCLEPCHVCR